MSLLGVRGLRVSAGGRELVHGVDLELERGEALGLVGKSGSGKTLTCRAILGALPGRCTVSGGTIELDGSFGAVFQDPASYLNPSLSVGRQLAEVLRVRGGLARRAARVRALELLDSVGLRAEVYRRIPAHLSGGMQQRAMLAIALSCEPDLLVADEPTSALDVKTQAEIVALLRERRDLALLFVSHDMAVVAELCDRVAVFAGGAIVRTGRVPVAA
jgi:ABC-type glutathione transport system ATPase component